jgi:hypothetical protein
MFQCWYSIIPELFSRFHFVLPIVAWPYIYLQRFLVVTSLKYFRLSSPVASLFTTGNRQYICGSFSELGRFEERRSRVPGTTKNSDLHAQMYVMYISRNTEKRMKSISNGQEFTQEQRKDCYVRVFNLLSQHIPIQNLNNQAA